MRVNANERAVYPCPKEIPVVDVCFPARIPRYLFFAQELNIEEFNAELIKRFLAQHDFGIGDSLVYVSCERCFTKWRKTSIKEEIVPCSVFHERSH
jgi:hypothetical protein